MVSNSSIRSIFLKQEAKKVAQNETTDPKSLPKEPFSEADFSKFWKIYIENLHQNGEKIQASNLEIGNATLKGTTIRLEIPNNTAKTEILRDENKLLTFLRQSLRNYDISLELIENEEIAKKIVITPEDKYNLLLEMNTSLHEFRKAFELNLSS